MPHIRTYTSDVHGNELQYQKLLDFSHRIHADSVIIGGDITPKAYQSLQRSSGNWSIDDIIRVQKIFLEERLPFFARQLKIRSHCLQKNTLM